MLASVLRTVGFIFSTLGRILGEAVMGHDLPSLLCIARAVRSREAGLEGVRVVEKPANGGWKRTGAVQAGEGTRVFEGRKKSSVTPGFCLEQLDGCHSVDERPRTLEGGQVSLRNEEFLSSCVKFERHAGHFAILRVIYKESATFIQCYTPTSNVTEFQLHIVTNTCYSVLLF